VASDRNRRDAEATVSVDVIEDARTIDLVACHKTSGEPVLESLVTRDGDARFRVEATPGRVLRVARGDLVAVDDTQRSFTIVERDGNVAIHVDGADGVTPLRWWE
jgi:hypothetical protein